MAPRDGVSAVKRVGRERIRVTKFGNPNPLPANSLHGRDSVARSHERAQRELARAQRDAREYIGARGEGGSDALISEMKALLEGRACGLTLKRC